MTRAILQSLCLLTLAVAVHAQSEVNDPLATLAKAEDLLAKGKKEDAVILARLAQSQLPLLDSQAVRNTLDKSLAEFLTKHDPVAAVRKKSEAEAATCLVGLAEQYDKAGWQSTAAFILGRAAKIDASSATGALNELLTRAPALAERLRGLPAELAQAPEFQTMSTWFTAARMPWGAAAWRIGADGIESPTVDHESSVILTSKSAGPRATISVQAKAAATDCQLALAFGAKTTATFFLVSLHHTAESSLLQVLQWNGKEFTILDSQPMRFAPAARQGWMTISVQCRDREIAVRAGTGPLRKVKVPSPDVSGAIGLCVDGPGLTPYSVQFRNLRVDEPSATEEKK